MKHISNQEKATEIAAERKRLYFDSDGLIINSEVECYAAAEEMAQWKDEQFAQEKKEIDEQWKRLMAESKSIGVDILQCKEEQYKKEKQKLIDEACNWLNKNDSYAIPTNVQVDRLREHLNKMKGE